MGFPHGFQQNSDGTPLGANLIGQADWFGTTCREDIPAQKEGPVGVYNIGVESLPSSYIAEARLDQSIIWNAVLNAHEGGHCLGLLHDNQSTQPDPNQPGYPGLPACAVLFGGGEFLIPFCLRTTLCGIGDIMWSSLGAPVMSWSSCSRETMAIFCSIFAMKTSFALHNQDTGRIEMKKIEKKYYIFKKL